MANILLTGFFLISRLRVAAPLEKPFQLLGGRSSLSTFTAALTQIVL
jgi:hypothetical protein